MSQRESGYARKERDLYETPEWATAALLSHLPTGELDIWEPAAGSGKMVRVLQTAHLVYASDIESSPSGLSGDFLAYRAWPDLSLPDRRRAVITNPPYELAAEFCAHALRLMEPSGGIVAMLLRTDFDHAQSRTHLFRDCPAFSKKLVLMRRIVWFVEADGKPKASPSYNHAWFIWDWQHEGAATLAYAP